MRTFQSHLKRILSMILIASILFTGVILDNPLYAKVEVKNALKAEALKELGLFLGTAKGFELDRVATRAEGAAMLVRLLGVESEAITANYTHPFTDVDSWASPYIGYLYQKGLTKGVSETRYDSKSPMTMNQYITFVLRALGYQDHTGLYTWNHAIDYAGTIHLLSEAEMATYKPMENQQILRDDVVALSFNGLFTVQYNSTVELLKRLLSEEAVTSDGLQAAGAINPIFSQYIGTTEPEIDNDEIKGVWISYIELKGIFDKKPSEESFMSTMTQYFDNVSALGLNTVFVHVRAFGDAIYPSQYVPWSYTLTGTEGTALSYDPLAIMVNLAHEKGLRIDAWLNPYRIRSYGSKTTLSAGNIASTWLADGSNRVIQNESGIFYNPASPDVRDLITHVVEEIIINYDVDGIHFDDYFYPSQKMDYDLTEYNTYKAAGGTLSQIGWRRENNNLLVNQVYAAIKAINPDIQFGISPQASMEANLNQQYIDVAKWASNPGYVDYICPQIYFGYLNGSAPYLKSLEDWNNKVTWDTVDLIIGLAAYKVGTEDKYAKEGRYEWQTGENILASMVTDARKVSRYKGFILFRYEQIFSPGTQIKVQMDKEITSLKEIM